VGFGGLVLMLALGFLVLGPKQMQKVLGQVARAKAELESATRGLKAQLTNELDHAEQKSKDLPSL
jgi:Sec-independent protein translocase protein TatA